MYDVHSAGPVQAGALAEVCSAGLAVAEVTDVQVLCASLYVKVKSQVGSAAARATAAKSGMARNDFIFASLETSEYVSW